jgi:predicted small lipoprotein YifL
MNRRSRSISAVIVAASLTLALSGCGNKGPLVLADEVPAETAVPAADTPVAAPATPAEPVATPPAAEDPPAKPPR